jgi:hypothetical protein
VPSLRSVKCSLHAPRSRSHQRHHSAFRASHLAQHRLLPAHLPTTNATPAPQQHSRTNLTPHPQLPSSYCPPLVPSNSNTRQQCAEARLHVERCCAAAQSPRWQGRRRGAVMGCRAADAAPERGLRRPAGGRRRRGRPGCPDAGHAVRRAVRVRCPPCGQTSVQLVGRTSAVQATGVHATGVIRVSGQTDVRCPRPLQPRCPHRAGSGIHGCGGTGHGWCTGFDVSLWSVSGLVVVARIGPGGDGMVERWPCAAGTMVDARPGPPLGMHTGCGAAFAAWPTKELVQRQVPVGWRGSTGRSRCAQVPRRCVWAGCRLMLDHGAGLGRGDHARWSLRWWLVPCRPAMEGPSGSAGSRLRPRRGRGMSGALSARS